MPAGVVEITNVRTYGGTGLSVTAFATEPNPDAVGKPGIGSSDKPLDQLGFDPTPPVTVETTCPADHDAIEPRHLTDFMVQVERPTAATFSFEGMLLDFTDGHASGTVVAPFGITLCGDRDRDEDCAR